LEHRRLEALELQCLALKPSQIAQRLNATWQNINRWLRAARRQGPRAVAAKPSPDKPSKLTVSRIGGLSVSLRGAAMFSGIGHSTPACWVQ